MTRKAFRRRPEVESLESMVLLSGFSTAAHHTAPALVVTLAKSHPNATIPVSGTVSGKFKTDKMLGEPINLKGKGNLSPIGKVKLDGSLLLSTTPMIGTATISAKKGTIFVNVSETMVGGPVSITITGGTGKYVGISGTGTGTLAVVNAKGNGPAHGKFTFTVFATVT